MVEIYALDIRTLPVDIENIAQSLPAAVQKKVKRIKYSKSRQQTIAAWSLLVFLLSEKGINDIKPEYNTYGKPSMQKAPCFNLSHSGNFVTVCLAEKQVGIDIQQHEEHDYIRMAKLVLTPSEQQALEQSDNIKQTFYWFWCLKESVMKAQGEGFHLSPKSFSFEKTRQPKLFALFENNYSFFVTEQPENYTIAVTASEPINETIHWIDWNFNK